MYQSTSVARRPRLALLITNGAYFDNLAGLTVLLTTVYCCVTLLQVNVGGGQRDLCVTRGDRTAVHTQVSRLVYSTIR